MLQAGSKITNRQRRSIAADHSVRTGGLLDTLQHWRLDFGPFKYRFFDKISFGDSLGHAGGSMKVISHQLRRAGLEQALLLEVFGLPAQPIKMAACQGGIGVARWRRPSRPSRIPGRCRHPCTRRRLRRCVDLCMVTSKWTFP